MMACDEIYHPTTVETYPLTFMLLFLAASSTDLKRSILSAIEQLTFFFVKDSEAAPNTETIVL